MAGFEPPGGEGGAGEDAGVTVGGAAGGASPEIASKSSAAAASALRRFDCSSSLSSGDGKDEQGQVEGSSGKGSKLSLMNNAHLARQRFTQRVQDIWSTVLESDVGTSGTLFYNSKKMYDSQQRSKFQVCDSKRERERERTTTNTLTITISCRRIC